MQAIGADDDVEPVLRTALEADVGSGAIVVQRVDGIVEPIEQNSDFAIAAACYLELAVSCSLS